MDAIDALIAGKVSKPASIASGEVPVWNGSAFVRSSVTNVGPTSLGSGTPDATKFLRGDGSWQALSTPTITYATTPPGAPANGDIWFAVDSTSAPTYQWQFRYNSGSASSFKWEFVGGSPATSFVQTIESTASGTFVDLTTVGPAFTLPRAGDWLFEFGAQVINPGNSGNGNATVALYSTAGTTTFGAGAVSNVFAVNGGILTMQEAWRQASLSSGDLIKLRYNISNALSVSFQNRWLKVTPIRVS